MTSYGVVKSRDASERCFHLQCTGYRYDSKSMADFVVDCYMGVESREGLGDERTEAAQACSWTEWYCVGQRVGRGDVEFSDEICYRLVRKIVTFGDSGINS